VIDLPDALRRACLVCIIAGVAIVLAIVPSVSDANAQILWNLTPEESADVRRIEDYLNGIKTMQARFTQINPDGSSAQGTLHIQRPGSLRFDYDPPDSYLIVANGVWFIYIDRELQQVSHIPLRQTLAWFLVRDPISLTDGVSITRFERGPGTMRVSFVKSDEPESGSVTFALSDHPLQLKSWSITDPQRQDTRVTIDSPKFGLALDPELFRFIAPPEWADREQEG
jgi:outer membrane lipoprotein-sorting protein